MATKKVKRSAQYSEALNLAQSPEYDPSIVLEKLESASAAGDDRAAYALATWYVHGNNVKRNVARAIELFELAASAGNASAKLNLAYSFEGGKGLPKDKRKAFLLYVAAALAGEKQAVYEVHRCYWYGIGTEVDKQLSDVWRDRADELGVSD